MLIQAYNRTKNHDVDLRDAILKFRPNAEGHVVCDVKEQRHIDILLAIPTGFRAYEPPPAAAPSPLLTARPTTVAFVPPGSKPADAPPDETLKYVLVSGESQFDLRPLDDDALHAFAKLNGIKVHHAKKGDSIRDEIVKGLAEQSKAKAEAEAGKGAEQPAA